MSMLHYSAIWSYGCSFCHQNVWIKLATPNDRLESYMSLLQHWVHGGSLLLACTHKSQSIQLTYIQHVSTPAISESVHLFSNCCTDCKNWLQMSCFDMGLLQTVFSGCVIPLGVAIQPKAHVLSWPDPAFVKKLFTKKSAADQISNITLALL